MKKLFLLNFILTPFFAFTQTEIDSTEYFINKKFIEDFVYKKSLRN
jgi:hypothetical protein